MSDNTEAWNRIIDGREPNGLVILVMALFETGEQLGYDLGWFEDGDWMLASKDNEPSSTIYPTHWCALPRLPEA